MKIMLIVIMLIISIIFLGGLRLFFSLLINLHPDLNNEIEEIFKHVGFGLGVFLIGIYFYIGDKCNLDKEFIFTPKYWYIYWPILSVSGLLYLIYQLYRLTIIIY